MSPHLSPELADHYRRRILAKPELIAADRHLAACPECRQLLADEDTVTRQIDSLRTDLRASLPPGHAEYTQLEAYVDQRLAGAERQALELHFKSCSRCAEELRDLQAFKVQLEEGQPVISKSLGTPAPSSLLSKLFLPFQGPWRSGSRWALAVCAVVALAVGIRLVWIWQHKANSVAHKPPTVPAPVPHASNTPEAVQVSLSYLPPHLLGIVTHAFRTQHIETPQGLVDAAIRRGVDEESFPLLTPVGAVVDSTQPVFRWKPVSNSDGYIVRVSDARQNLVEASPMLTATSWKPATALRRGKVYVWQVAIIKDGEEVQESALDAAQGRFQVLDASQSRQLHEIQRAHPEQHFVLGILFAHAGMLEEAAGEFTIVPPSDPHRELAEKFARETRDVISGRRSQI